MTLTEALAECAAAKARRDAHMAAWKAADADAPGYLSEVWSDEYWVLHYEHNAAHREVMRLVNEQLDSEFPEEK